jgi:hypothetical protein
MTIKKATVMRYDNLRKQERLGYRIGPIYLIGQGMFANWGECKLRLKIVIHQLA